MSLIEQKSTKHKRWVIALTTVLILLIAGYTSRELLQRSITAYVIYNKHVFIPPPQDDKEFWMIRMRNHVLFYWDISKLRIARDKRVAQFNPSLKPLVKEINRHQAAGEVMQYSMNIYREIRWRLNFTCDTTSTRLRINDLRQSLSQPTLQKSGLMQQSSDGSWGAGISEWYLRLYYSVENMQDSLHPRYSYSFLDRINSPEKLTEQLESDLYNDFTKTKVFNREELDETFSAIARLLNKRKKMAYTFHPQLDSALKDFVKRWQNPETGCWGQWMVDRYGKVWKMDDMGITFHVISDLHGQVDHTDLIAKRLLELKNIDFPSGIKFDGDYNNHLNWDAVKIFRYAWPNLDSAIREKVRTEISEMLNWCLSESYQPDGSFKISDMDDTIGDAYSYGVTFLNETGYFRDSDRFWTNQNFPKAKSVHDHIKAKILSIGLDDPGLKDAYETLNGKSF